LYAEIGTCFDAFVKEYIMKKRGMKIPALKLAYTMNKIKHPAAIEEGRKAAIAYVKTPLVHQFLTASEVHLEQELTSRHGVSNEGYVGILGRIDAIVDGRVVEWKCRGWSSQTSCYPGYSDRYDCQYATGSIMQRPQHDKLSEVEEFSFEWATQLLFYNWLLRNNPREYEIHEIVKRDDGIVIVQHKGCISEEFEKRVTGMLAAMWENLTGGFYHTSIDKPNPCRETCHKWGNVCEVSEHCEYYREWLKNNGEPKEPNFEELI